MKLPKVKQYSYLIRLLFFSGFVLFPLIFWPNNEIPYEIPKVNFFILWAEFLSIAGLIFSIKKKVNTPKFFPVILVLGFVITAILSSILGPDLTKSFWGNYYRHDGLFTLFHLAGIFFFLTLYWNKNWIIPFIYAVTSGTALASLWIIGDGMRLFIFGDKFAVNWEGAIGASFGQPNFAAGYLLITLPFYYWLFYTCRKNLKPFVAVFFMAQLFAILFTRSLGGIIGIIFGFILFYLLSQNIHHKTVWILSFIFISILGIFFFSYRERNSGFQPEGRSRIFTRILLGASEKPLLGWGWANVDYAFNKVPYPMWFEHDIYLDKAHSSLLEVFAATGIIGLMIYLAIIIFVLKSLFYYSFHGDKNDRIWLQILLMVFMLYLFHSQTNIISIAEELFFWVILGVVSVKNEKPLL